MMSEIGGYFELELDRSNPHYHESALKLNTGRNAWEYILRAYDIKKVYIPYFICESMLEPIKKLDIAFEFYSIDFSGNILLDLRVIKKQEMLLYVNYFGVNDKKVDEVIEEFSDLEANLCIDNTQAFFSKAHKDIPTLYSARKFFGVPDGSYLYCKKRLLEELSYQKSYFRFNHLVKRIDLNAESAYGDYKKNDDLLSNLPIRKMSRISSQILSSINYKEVKRKRKDNFIYLHERLKEHNNLKMVISDIECPMVYPFFHLNGEEIRSFLISKKVFVAKYWPNVLNEVGESTVEHQFAKNIVAIPIDQRYGTEEMDTILNLLRSF